MRVLLADDDPVTVTIITNVLRRLGFEVIVARDGQEALDILTGPTPPQMVILDWEMPKISGLDVCRCVRTLGDEPYTWIVMLTGRTDTNDVTEAMNAGVDSVIHKPVGMEELKARLRPGIRMLEMQRQLINTREEYRYQARHDELTGLLSRKAVLDALKAALARGPVTVAMADVDHFKRVNDGWGHEIGDKVLTQVADEMRLAVRPEDFLGRLGGEEFLVVLPGCEEAEGLSVGERLRLRMENHQIQMEARKLTITVSIGVATATRPEDFATLLRAADRALYAAKNAGRNRVVGSKTRSPGLTQAT